MSGVNPILPAQLLLQPTPVQLDREGRPHDLRTDQIVRAVVVEGGNDRVLLELNQRRYEAQTELLLKAGQQLDVRVVQTQPSLQLQILSPDRDESLLQLLSALGSRPDWTDLLQQLDRQLQAGLVPSDRWRQALRPTLELMRELLTLPAEEAPALDGPRLAGLSRLLGLATEVEALRDGILPANLKTALWALAAERRPAAESLLGRLVQQALTQLEGWGRQPAATGEQATVAGEQATSLLGTLAEMARQWPVRDTPPLPLLTHDGLAYLQRQLQRATAEGGQRLAALLRAQPQPPVASGAPAAGATAAFTAEAGESPPPVVPLRNTLLQLLGRLPPHPEPDSPPARAQQLVRQLWRQIEVPVAPTHPSAAATTSLVARVRELLPRLARLQELLPPADAELLEPARAELERLLPLLARALPAPEAAAWGRLQFLLGPAHDHPVPTDDEPLPPSVRVLLEVALGLSRLDAGTQAHRHVERAVQHLQLFQVARERLAADGVQLLPLPLPFLEEGYLLVEQREARSDGEAGGTRLSLHLQLQALGPLRVDLLGEGGGLYLRFVCGSAAAERFLTDCRPELEAMLTALPLRGVSFTTGAVDPGAELIRRLQPDRSGVLDQRV